MDNRYITRFSRTERTLHWVHAAAFLVPAASWLQSYTGSWHAVFVVASVTNICVAATALLIVKPMRAAASRRTFVDMPAIVK